MAGKVWQLGAMFVVAVVGSTHQEGERSGEKEGWAI